MGSFWNMVLIGPLFFAVIDGALMEMTVGDDEHARLYIGGSEVANIEDAPYTVALFETNNDRQVRIMCTGSIIDEKWVITAAHCILPQPFEQWIAAGSNSAIEISTAFKSKGEPVKVESSVQIRQMSRTIKHPRYKFLDEETGKFVARFDVSLCEVKRWSFGSTVNKIGLFADEWNGSKDPGKNYRFQECNSYGWGVTSPEDTNSSPFLRTAVFKTRHGSKACACLKPYMNRRLLCTGPDENEHSACPGDSGGPLVCGNKLAGVTHINYIHTICLFELERARFWDYGELPIQMAPGERQCGQKHLISAWIYVCPVMGWIREYVPEAPKPPLSCRSPPLPTLSSSIAAAALMTLKII